MGAQRTIEEAMRALHAATRDDEDHRDTFLDLAVVLLTRGTRRGASAPSARVARLDADVVSHMLSEATEGSAARAALEVRLACRLMGPAIARTLAAETRLDARQPA